MEKIKPEIAVIGTGISGLCAAHFLSKFANVSTYEKSDGFGMAQEGFLWKEDQNSFTLDVPFRTFKKDYYPTLDRLYSELNIPTSPVEYSMEITEGKKPIFRLNQVNIFGYKTLFPDWKVFSETKSRSLLFEILSFYRNGHKQILNEKDGISLREFLAKYNYSPELGPRFLYPTFALVNTCKTDSVADYPAQYILDYHKMGFGYSPQYTASLGTQSIVNTLSKSWEISYFGIKDLKVNQKKEKIQILTENHSKEYDHVVIATQANKINSLLGDEFNKEKSVLSQFPYETSEVILHTDSNFFPSENVSLQFTIDPNHDKPMVTLDVNRIHKSMKRPTPKIQIFQTWNPHSLPHSSKILKESKFERPLVKTDSLKLLPKLQEIHNRSNNQIWFCGTYSLPGIPLLEAGAKSALLIAQKITNQKETEFLKGI